MPKDQRYKVVKQLFEADALPDFKQIFIYIPKSIVAEDMRISYRRFVNLVDTPAEFRLEEIWEMAGLLGIDERKFVHFVFASVLSSRKR